MPAGAHDADAFDFRHLRCSVLVFRDICGVEHVLLQEEYHRIQLDVHKGSVLAGPVRLHYDLAGIIGVGAKLLTLQRLLALFRLGRFPRTLFPPEPRARRWAMALQAFDGRKADASQWEIATALFGLAPEPVHWHGLSRPLRCRVQRLLHLADTLVDGGYRDMLQSPE